MGRSCAGELVRGASCAGWFCGGGGGGGGGGEF